MILERIPVGHLQANCYIMGDKDTKQVVVIDPGDQGEIIYQIIIRNGYEVQSIIVTHGHMDHIGAVKYIKEKTGAPVVIHEADSSALTDSVKNLSALMGLECVQVPADIELKNGDHIKVGKYELQVIHTPGHSPGGICILTEDILFSGDTLFQQSVGRTDLPGGNPEQLIHIIRDKLFILPDDTKVYPGHGPSTTIAEEKQTNPYLQGGI